MKKIIYFFIFLCLIFSVYCDEYQEVMVSGRKVIKGISQGEALKEFGVPLKGSADFWYYGGINPFYVYFAKTAHKPTLFVIPYSYNTRAGIPFEVKAFVSYPDFRVEEVTQYVNWLITNKSKVERKKNFFMSLKQGNTKIFALYKNMTSNACNIFVARLSEDKKSGGNEVLLAINVFPHKPVLQRGEYLTFLAFGTFYSPRFEKISVRNISAKVKWFLRDERGARKEQSNIHFTRSGKQLVFCEYKGIKSNIQEIIVRKNPLRTRKKIKNIRLLPDFAEVDKGTEIDMEVIATYDDNMVEIVSARSSWKIDDRKVIRFIDKGVVKSQKEGIAKVYVSMDETQSSFSKILVAKKVFAEKVEIKEAVVDLADVINRAVRSLDPEDIKIKYVEINPGAVTVALGRTVDFTAEAVYSNGLRVDVVSLARWRSVNPENVTVKKGKLSTHSPGQAAVYAYLEGIKSNFAKITVGEPELTSIVLEGQELRLEVGNITSFKATGHYSDSSEKNITSEAEWHIENNGLLEASGSGIFKAAKKGLTNIYARYGKIKSLPAAVEIFISPVTVLKKIIFILLTACGIALLLFYALIKIKVNNLKKTISDNPSRFIEKLYENSKKVLGVFSIPHINTIPALQYAKTVEEKFSIDGGHFLKLTRKFSEAQYSSHVISSEDALYFLDNYNKSMDKVRKGSYGFLFRFCVLLVRGYPFLM